MDERVTESPTTGELRNRLIKQGLDPQFKEKFERIVASQMGLILEDEMRLSRHCPELYTLPEGAIVELPGFEDATMEEVEIKWIEFKNRYQDPDRFMTPFAYSRKNPQTWLKYDLRLSGFSRQGFWTCYNTHLDGNHLPLTFENLTGQPTLKLKPRLLSEDDFTALVGVLSVAFGDTRDPSDMKQGIRQGIEARKTNEAMVLNLLVNDPEAFASFFKKDEMYVIPNRLMTDQELEEWMQMLDSVIAQKDGVFVGEPGWGSYVRLEGIFRFGLGMALKKIDLDKDGVAKSSFSLNIPVPVKQRGGRTIGWTICHTWHSPEDGFISAEFHHGASELYWYKYTRK